MNTPEFYARASLNEAAETLINRQTPGEFRKPDDVTIIEALQAQTQALMGLGYWLEAIHEELQLQRMATFERS